MKPTAAAVTMFVSFLCLASGCGHSVSDISFAQGVYKGLTSGNQSVADEIDWPHFQTGSTNVGAVYIRYPGEENQAAFKTSFIDNFSKSYLAAGGNASSLSHWSLERSTPDVSVVGATTVSGRRVRFNITKANGNRLLESITYAQ